jgi:8-oxo-dGTP diphosphatase
MAMHTVAVGGYVTNANNEVLLVKNPIRGWEFPGGVVEAGESLPHALIREIQEESGVRVIISGIIGVYKNIENDIVNIDFRCTYESGILTKSDESIEVGWFSVAQAKEVIKHPLYIQRFQNMIEVNGQFFCCAFKKEPYTVTELYKLSIGL